MSVALRPLAAITTLLLCTAAFSTDAQTVLTEGTNLSVDVAADGRIVMDLLGGIWIVPPNGGQASPANHGLLPAKRPRWSPDGAKIVFQARTGGRDQLRLYVFDSDTVSVLSDGEYFDQHHAWHPDGTRIAYSSERRDSGFDIWEIDVETGLTWRLTSLSGDETEPVWSADGRDLVYVHETGGIWSVQLRRRGSEPQTIVSSEDRLSAPSLRPDGSLITYLRESDAGLVIEMAILSDPVLTRVLVEGEDLFDAPVAWDGRLRMLYAADGVIRERPFNSWASTTVPFRASVQRRREAHSARAALQRELPIIDAPQGRMIIRSQRLYGGAGRDYRENLDVVLEDGLIAAVEARRDRPQSGEIVIDMGDLTMLPGFVDSYAWLPDDVDASLGPVLLSYGITTIVADHALADSLNEVWSGNSMPGPRVLRARDIVDASPDDPMPWLVAIDGDLASGTSIQPIVDDWHARGVPVLAHNWHVALGSGASMVLSGESLPASPSGTRYKDTFVATGVGPLTLVSGLADARTPGLDKLFATRQTSLLGSLGSPLRRFASTPQLPAATSSIIIGSKPNRLPPGIAFHAELRALDAAGLDAEVLLRAAGINAAGALSADRMLGRIAAGALADLILVDGDPLSRIGDATKVVAVVRNGRFFSVAGLLDIAGMASTP